MALNSKQRAHLRSLAHHLKPVHHIGKEGVSESALAAVSDAFNQRELLKVKVQEAAPISAAAAGELLSAGLPGVEHVQTIGRTVVLYRRHPERPELKLPE
jgi:RNA-binding protein